MLRPNPQLIINRGLVPPVSCGAPEIPGDYNAFLTTLIAQAIPQPNLPPHPPFEIHPYRDLLPLQNFEKYIIGTFPPISYILDNPDISAAGITSLIPPAGNAINAPEIPFYHGNIGSMWKYFLTPIEIAQLLATPRAQKSALLIGILTNAQINYADIIDSCQRQGFNANDTNLYNICINRNLICHIITNPDAKSILFHSASIFGINGFNNNGQVQIKSFDLFVKGCQEIGLTVEIQINQGHNPALFFPWTDVADLIHPQRINKMAFQMKLTNATSNIRCSSLKPGESKVLEIITGPSPAGAAILGILNNNNFLAWQGGDPLLTPTLFLRFIYESFRNNFNWLPFYNLNQ